MRGGNLRGLGAEAGSRQVVIRGVVVWWIVSQAAQAKGLGARGRARAGALGRPGSLERRAGVCQDGCLEEGAQRGRLGGHALVRSLGGDDLPFREEG